MLGDGQYDPVMAGLQGQIWRRRQALHGKATPSMVRKLKPLPLALWPNAFYDLVLRLEDKAVLVSLHDILFSFCFCVALVDKVVY